MLPRQENCRRLETLLALSPIVAILGARQVGKTTLAHQLAERWEGQVTRFDLEDAEDLARLDEPKLTLGRLKGLVILDEIQRRPELFPVLRVLVDRLDHDTRFLILGSASPNLLRQSSESLAGRIVYHELGGLRLDEVGVVAADELWLRGGFPRSFLAPSTEASAEWRRGLLRSFLERDLPQLGIRVPSPTLHRFWRMIAHYHGQVWNAAELARSFGVSSPTVRSYLDLLTGTLVLRQLPAWFENIAKRQVRSPKVYVTDSGLLHTLLGLETRDDLEGHPKIGASWEGFVVQEVIARLGARPDECFFWATHGGAELDLLVVRGNRRLGIEVKRTASPTTTRSMHVARETLGLERLLVVHAGEECFEMKGGIEAVAFERLFEEVEPL